LLYSLIMCGLVAILSHKFSHTVNESDLSPIRDFMNSRGRDDHGCFISDNKKVGLGHRRMSIIDTSDQGHQPMSSASNEKIKIIYNGEIYNYLTLRNELISKGYKFNSETDTEVILNGYLEWGEKLLNRLEGMFAFVIYDENKNLLFVARDPFGIKPLYISVNPKNIIIASQVKAILQSKDVSKERCSEGHVSFFLWGHVSEPYTFYKSIKAVKAGTFLIINHEGKIIEKEFFNISTYYRDNNFKNENFALAIGNSVKKHLVSDVSLGVFLSSGIDSSVVAYHVAKNSKEKIKTLSIGFENFINTDLDETVLALKTSRQIGSDHKTSFINDDSLKNEMDNFISKMDQPTTDGFNMWLACKEANKMGCKVMLTGLGGDELFSGYPSFNQIPNLLNNKLVSTLRFLNMGTILRKISYPIIKSFVPPKYAGIVEYSSSVSNAFLLRRGFYMPWEIQKHLSLNDIDEALSNVLCDYEMQAKEFQDLSINLQIKILEQTKYMKDKLLKDMDWIGYEHEIELRTPLLDLNILNFSMGCSKTDLFNTTSDLPIEILRRSKTGFATPSKIYSRENKKSNRRKTTRAWHSEVYEKYLSI
jgi:asparagine synthase (glutamine-hydrolysing)